uniref:Ig-like domain-containing protein n=1 Tax=Gopherus agassizii TaxID=38772 RepID=A0A452HPW7_9SAUR
PAPIVCPSIISCNYGFTITVHVDPAIALVGKVVMLSCQPVGQNPAKIQVHWYKWERSKNTTLYFYNSTENGTELGWAVDQHRSDAPRGRYENGVVRVKLFPVQVEDSGQYVCAVTSDGVYKEAIAQVIVAGKLGYVHTEVLLAVNNAALITVALILHCTVNQLGAELFLIMLLTDQEELTEEVGGSGYEMVEFRILTQGRKESSRIQAQKSRLRLPQGTDEQDPLGE